VSGAEAKGDVVSGGPIILSVVNLRKTYKLGRTEVPVLRGVSLDVREGEFLAILGASGSGKSTLLHLMGGLDRPDAFDTGFIVPGGKGGAAGTGEPSGTGQSPALTGPATIQFRGEEITKFSTAKLDRFRAADVGFVFQFYHLLPELTVLENVTIAQMIRGKPGKERAAALLDQVGLSHRLRHRPIELSGGERQRVAIARALVNQPAILLADEPTGNLDHATGQKILDMLGAIRASTRQTMVVVTHDSATAARADRVVRLADGVVER
jgi:lipoprotein-releasing system ATP-binding protein